MSDVSPKVPEIVPSLPTVVGPKISVAENERFGRMSRAWESRAPDYGTRKRVYRRPVYRRRAPQYARPVYRRRRVTPRWRRNVRRYARRRPSYSRRWH